jgi:hypothetical protein
MRAVKTLAVIMGVLIVVGFTALIVIIVGRVTHPAGEVKSATAKPTQPFTAPPIELPAGARIEALAAGPDRLVLHVAMPDGGGQLIVVDLATGRRLGIIPVHIAP